VSGDLKVKDDIGCRLANHIHLGCIRALDLTNIGIGGSIRVHTQELTHEVWDVSVVTLYDAVVSLPSRHTNIELLYVFCRCQLLEQAAEEHVGISLALAGDELTGGEIDVDVHDVVYMLHYGTYDCTSNFRGNKHSFSTRGCPPEGEVGIYFKNQ